MNALEMVVGGHPSSRSIAWSQRDDEYVATVDVSDFDDEELAVEVIGRDIVVRADHFDRADHPLAGPERLEESLRLPDDADGDRIAASFLPGALEIRARRRKTRRHRISIEPYVPAGHVPKGC